MPQEADQARPQLDLERKGAKPYEPPYLRKRERLAEVTAGLPVVVPPIPTT